jgi:hypothetical protein
MPFVPPDSDERSLTDALVFIQEQDGCSRIEAWDQFRRMVPLSRKWLWSAVWADRQAVPPSNGLPITRPSDNVGPFGDWVHASLEDDDRVRFAGAKPRSIKIFLWSHFVSMWRHHHRPLGAPEPPSTTPSSEVDSEVETDPAAEAAASVVNFDAERQRRGRPGRKRGSGSVDDEAALRRMLGLLAKGEEPSVLAAARTVAHAAKSNQSVEADVARLRKKFAERWGTEPPPRKKWADVARDLDAN